MTAPPDDTTTDTSAIIAALRAERDAAMALEATLAEALATRDAALAQRNSEFGERIEHQAATVDILKAMSASPGNAQPVIDLIVSRAKELSDAFIVSLQKFDGELVHFREWGGIDPVALASCAPQIPSRSSIFCRAIIDGHVVHVRASRAVRARAELVQIGFTGCAE
jgi:hypothetical protein